MGEVSFLGIRDMYKEVCMSKETALVPVERGLQKTRRRMQPATSFPKDPGLHQAAEVVSDEDARFDKALQRKAQSPTDFIKEASRIQPPLVQGALVGLDTLLGFLAAMEMILPPESNYPMLGSVKVSFDPNDHPKLFLEGGSHSVWTIVAIAAEPKTKKGFQALMPVRRAKNVLRAASSAQRNVMVGVDDKGVCVGSHAVPFGGVIDDFPAQPVMVKPIARAVMPAFYYQEIVTRVMPARSTSGFGGAGSQGVLIDFDVLEVDGEMRPICIAVATDGDRMHILYLPRTMIEAKSNRLPPAMRVHAGLFRYMRAIVKHEWSGIEFSTEHMAVMGKDFIAIAKVNIEPPDEPSELSGWRDVNVDHRGNWMVDATLFEKAIRGAPSRTVRLKVDSMYDSMTIQGESEDGTRYREDISVRRNDGAPHVDVRLNTKFLLDAVRACSTKLVRVSFEHNKKHQSSSPVILKGEDEQFKAIVMPIAGGNNA
jgi:hypothetical protein